MNNKVFNKALLHFYIGKTPCFNLFSVGLSYGIVKISWENFLFFPLIVYTSYPPLGDSPILIGSQSRDRRLLTLIKADSVSFYT